MPIGIYVREKKYNHICACGCGIEFKSSIKRALYLNKEHYRKHRCANKKPFINHFVCIICHQPAKSKSGKAKVCEHCRPDYMRKLNRERKYYKRLNPVTKPKVQLVESTCPKCRKKHTVEAPIKDNPRDHKWRYCPDHEHLKHADTTNLFSIGLIESRI